MSEPTPAEIEAGARALDRHMGITLPYVATQLVLRAVLPDHDARVRADAAQQMLNWLALHGQSSMPGWLLEQAEQEIHVIARQSTGEDTDHG